MTRELRPIVRRCEDAVYDISSFPVFPEELHQHRIEIHLRYVYVHVYTTSTVYHAENLGKSRPAQLLFSKRAS